MKSPLIAAILAMLANAHAATVIDVGSDTVQTGVRRFGVALAQHNYYDSAQMMKELLFRNPGFEGLLYQSVVRLGPGGTATSAIEDQPLGQWPTGYWVGGTYEVIWSNGSAKGRAGSIITSIAPNRVNVPNDASGSTQGTTYVFANGGVAPGDGDYMVLRRTETGGTGSGAAYGSWELGASGGGTITSELTDLPPPPAVGPAGQQCVRLTALTTGQQAAIRGTFDTTTGFIRLNGAFRIAFKARGVGGANQVLVNVRRGSTSYLSRTIQLTNGWADYAPTFNVSEPLTATGAVVVEFSPVNQSALLLDDVSLRQTDSDPGNPTEFRDEVVNALRDMHPGILRYVNWQDQGNSLDNALAPVFARKRSGYSSYSTAENNMMPGLHEFFTLCEHIGADPWYCIPPCFSTQEVANFMEYLGGDTSTPYGLLRAQRGHPAPWTGVFGRIHLEFANENWNNQAYRGGCITSPVPCGNRASELFGVIKGSGYYVAGKFQCIVGGQPGNTTLTTQLHNACALSDCFTMAPYMAARVDSFASNEEMFGPLFAEPEWWSTNPSFTTGLMRYAYDQLQSSSRPVPISVYEVNLHTTQGNISQSALDSFTPSVGAAIGVADHMLTMLKLLGAKDQVFFSLGGYRYTRTDAKTVAIWGSVLDMGKTNRKRPHYYAMQMLNDVLAGDMIRSTHTGDNPTWSVNNMNRVTYTGANHVQSFAFRNGNQRALVLFNLHRTDALDVNFTGPQAPAGTVTMRRLTSANITDGNESAEVVAPVTTALPEFNPGQNISLPPFSMTVLTWTQPALHAWRYQHFGTVAGAGAAADDADPDGDGSQNLVEYATGTFPVNSGSARPVVTTVTDASGERYLTVSIDKNPAATDVAFTAQVSSDLIQWNAGAPHIVVLENSATRFTARDATPLSARQRRFISVKVTAP